MDPRVTQEVQRELRSGEKTLWTGQPAQGLRLQQGDLVLVPFSLLWGGFAVYWEWSVLQSGGPLFFLLFGAVFVAVGFHIVVGRFFTDAWRRKRTYYALTTDRVLIVKTGSSREVTSLDLARLSDLSLREASGGSGTIILGSIPGPFGGMQSWFAGSGWPGMSRYMPPAFESIPGVRRVYDSLCAARDEAREVGA
jgi:hypothetical protein